MKRFLVIAALLAGCGDSTSPDAELPHIDAPAEVAAQAHPSGPYCVLTWTLVGDAEWERGLMVFRNAGGLEVGRADLDVPVVLGGELVVSRSFLTADLSIPWRTANAAGTATHTFRCT